MKNVLSFVLHLSAITTLAIFYHEVSPPAPEADLLPATTTPASIASSSFTEPAPTEIAPSASTSVAEETPASLADQIAVALRSGSRAERDRAFQQLLPRLIATDPSAAGHLALAWESGPMRDELLRQVIHHWSEADIGGVLTWLTSLLDADDRRLAAAASTAQVAQADPAGALDLAQVLRVGLDDGSFEHLAQIWTEDDPRAAVTWVKFQPAGPMRDRLLARIAWVRAQSDPAEAAGLVLKQMNSGEAQTQALIALVRQWAVREPTDAAEWVTHFPAGSLRTAAFAELAIARSSSNTP